MMRALTTVAALVAMMSCLCPEIISAEPPVKLVGIVKVNIYTISGHLLDPKSSINSRGGLKDSILVVENRGEDLKGKGRVHLRSPKSGPRWNFDEWNGKRVRVEGDYEDINARSPTLRVTKIEAAEP